jgi:hypothetical protein
MGQVLRSFLPPLLSDGLSVFSSRTSLNRAPLFAASIREFVLIVQFLVIHHMAFGGGEKLSMYFHFGDRWKAQKWGSGMIVSESLFKSIFSRDVKKWSTPNVYSLAGY